MSPRRVRELKGVLRGYIWKLHPHQEQVRMFKQYSKLCVELWNGLLDISYVIYANKIWYFDKEANGPILLGLDGSLYELDLNDVLWWRRATHGTCRSLPLKPYNKKCRWDQQHIKNVGWKQYTKETGWRTKVPTAEEMSFWVAKKRLNPDYSPLSTWIMHRVSDILSLAWKRYFTPGHERHADLDYSPPRFKDFKKVWFPGRVLNPRLGVGGSGCKIKKATGKNKWLIEIPGVSDDIKAYREPPPGDLYEYKYYDIYFYDNSWWFAVSTDIEPTRRRSPLGKSVTIRFNTIDYFAEINDVPFNPQITYQNTDKHGIRRSNVLDFRTVIEAEFKTAKLKSEVDLKYPRNKFNDMTDEEKDALRFYRKKIAHSYAHIARMRRELNHQFSKYIIDLNPCELTILNPKVKYHTKSPRGDETNWGAVIKPVSELNHYILSQSVGKTITLLKYKADELGIKYKEINDPNPIHIIGKMMVTAGKKCRLKGRSALKQFVEVPGIESEIAQLNLAMYYSHTLQRKAV